MKKDEIKGDQGPNPSKGKNNVVISFYLLILVDRVTRLGDSKYLG